MATGKPFKLSADDPSDHYHDGNNPAQRLESYCEALRLSGREDTEEYKLATAALRQFVVWRGSDRSTPAPTFTCRPLEAVQPTAPARPVVQPQRGNEVNTKFEPAALKLTIEYNGTALSVVLDANRDEGWTQLAVVSELLRNLYDVGTLRPGSGSHEAAQFECVHAIERLKSIGAIQD